MSIGLYSHTTRATGTVLTAAIYNSDHVNHITNQNPSMTGGYSDNVGQMQLTVDPGSLGSESLATSLAGELERIRFAISRLVGGTQWYDSPGGGVGQVLLTSGTAANVNELDIVFDPTNFQSILIHMWAAPSNDGADLQMRTSSDSGSNFDLGASDYSTASFVMRPGVPDTTTFLDASVDLVLLAADVGSNVNEFTDVELLIMSPGEAGRFTHGRYTTHVSDFADDYTVTYGGFRRQDAGVINAVRFFFSAGQLESAGYSVLGIRK